MFGREMVVEREYTHVFQAVGEEGFGEAEEEDEVGCGVGVGVAAAVEVEDC